MPAVPAAYGLDSVQNRYQIIVQDSTTSYRDYQPMCDASSPALVGYTTAVNPARTFLRGTGTSLVYLTPRAWGCAWNLCRIPLTSLCLVLIVLRLLHRLVASHGCPARSQTAFRATSSIWSLA